MNATVGSSRSRITLLFVLGTMLSVQTQAVCTIFFSSKISFAFVVLLRFLRINFKLDVIKGTDIFNLAIIVAVNMFSEVLIADWCTVLCLDLRHLWHS
jgi:hypothetical protein